MNQSIAKRAARAVINVVAFLLLAVICIAGFISGCAVLVLAALFAFHELQMFLKVLGVALGAGAAIGLVAWFCIWAFSEDDDEDDGWEMP